MTRTAEVLEVMAEEIAGHPVEALASFTNWDEGRRKLDGMRRGRPFVLEDDDDIKRLAHNVHNRRYEHTHAAQRRASKRRWRQENPDLVAAQNRRADESRRRRQTKRQLELKRERGRAAYRKKIGRDPRKWTDPVKLSVEDLAKVADPGYSMSRLVAVLGVSNTTIKRWRRRAWAKTMPTLRKGTMVTLRAGKSRRIGRVVAIVPPGLMPDHPRTGLPSRWKDQLPPFRGRARPVVSYVVLSGGGLCWPRPNSVGRADECPGGGPL